MFCLLFDFHWEGYRSGFHCVAQTKFKLRVLLFSVSGIPSLCCHTWLNDFGLSVPLHLNSHASCYVGDDSSSKVLPCLWSCLLSLLSSHAAARITSRSRTEARIDQAL